ncbi:hypothetical protein EAG_12685 [Camponotus floridanus]|uniref:Uncharacterized protein n=1 Tax=Camponotus floridanus TaxID=104421 RepID=E2AXX8_CAMFO|nr:hypothetical protein EAG_12685 [Camponotus floridanus]
MPCRDVGLSDVPETKILSAKKQTNDEESRAFLFPLPKTGLLSTLSVQVDAVDGREKRFRPRMLRDLVARRNESDSYGNSYKNSGSSIFQQTYWLNLPEF